MEGNILFCVNHFDCKNSNTTLYMHYFLLFMMCSGKNDPILVSFRHNMRWVHNIPTFSTIENAHDGHIVTHNKGPRQCFSRRDDSAIRNSCCTIMRA